MFNSLRAVEKKLQRICLVKMYWMCWEILGCPVVIEQPGSISHALHKGPVVKRVLTDARGSGVTASRQGNVSKWTLGYASGCLQMGLLEVISATFSALVRHVDAITTGKSEE